MADAFVSSVNIGGLVFTDWITQNAVDAIYANTVIAPQVRFYDASAVPSKTYSIPKLAAVTAPASVGETALISRSAFTATNIDVSPTIYGKLITIPDFSQQVNVMGPQIAGMVARNIGTMYGVQADTDLAAQLAGLSVIGNGASTMSTSFFLQSIYKLESRNALARKVATLHSKQIHDLRIALSSVNASAAGWESGFGVTGATAPNGFAGRLYGVDVYASNLVTKTGATIDSALFCAGQDEAPVGIVVWSPLRTEAERTQQQFSDTLKFQAVWGVATVDPLKGVTVRSK